MLLHSCRVQNYRALREASLDLDPTTVLVGENDCGKSSLLNALEACLGRGATSDGFHFSPPDFHRPRAGAPPAGPIRLEVRLREAEAPAASAPWPGLRAAGLAGEDGRLDFTLAVEADLDAAGQPRSRFHLHGPRPFTGDPLAALAEIRRACPFIRVRSAVLRPAPGDAGQEVEWEIRQGFSELVEDPDRLSEQAIDSARQALVGVLGRLEERAHPPSALEPEDRVLAPLSPTGSWPRVAGLLRGSGARSLAMLAFTGAFLEARGPEALPPDSRPVVSIEDPEAHLHPMMLASVWSLIHRLPAQKIVTTNSSALLAAIPLGSLRRMVRSRRGEARLYRVPPGAMSLNDLRRIAYHLRVRRGAALFTRFWLLVEGESEFWMLPEVARALDLDLQQEGVECLEFAQCGLAPLASLANHLGIGWHLLADGDAAGQHYAEQARPLARAGLGAVTVLAERDLENCMWAHGYEAVFREAAGLSPVPRRNEKPRDVIERAIKHLSKPRLALLLGEAMATPGSPGVPPALEGMVRDAVHRAHHGTAVG